MKLLLFTYEYECVVEVAGAGDETTRELKALTAADCAAAARCARTQLRSGAE